MYLIVRGLSPKRLRYYPQFSISLAMKKEEMEMRHFCVSTLEGNEVWLAKN